jgi:hypothetical protein
MSKAPNANQKTTRNPNSIPKSNAVVRKNQAVAPVHLDRKQKKQRDSHVVFGIEKSTQKTHLKSVKRVRNSRIKKLHTRKTHLKMIFSPPGLTLKMHDRDSESANPMFGQL